jgi:hypothetical protein
LWGIPQKINVSACFGEARKGSTKTVDYTSLYPKSLGKTAWINSRGLLELYAITE